MRYSPIFVAAIAACALLGAQACAAPRPDASRVADALLDALVETNGVPGMAAAYAADGQLEWTGVAGVRDVETGTPIESDTEFRLASVSKVITAVAGARLVEAGRLDPDAPVQGLLPYLRNDWPPISARQLAAHTSGIPHYQAIDQNRGGEHFAQVRDAVAVFSDRELLAAPGQAYSYSSYGFTLLSAAIESAAAEPFLDFVADDVVTGLAIRPDTDPPGALYTGLYEFTDSGGVRRVAPHDYSYSYGGAGFRGSAPAVAMFGARVMSDVFLSDATRTFMWTPATLANGSPVRDEEDLIGFGWRIGVDADGARIVHHAGVTSGARSALVLYPDTGESVSVVSNALWVAAIKETAIMLAAPFRVHADPNAAACPTYVTRYEGRFDGGDISGSASFALIDGVCRGRISANNAMGQWFNAFPQADADHLPIIALTTDERLGRAALVTPAGIYDFRCRSVSACHAAFGVRRVLDIAFH